MKPPLTIIFLFSDWRVWPKFYSFSEDGVAVSRTLRVSGLPWCHRWDGPTHLLLWVPQSWPCKERCPAATSLREVQGAYPGKTAAAVELALWRKQAGAGNQQCWDPRFHAPSPLLRQWCHLRMKTRASAWWILSGCKASYLDVPRLNEALAAHLLPQSSGWSNEQEAVTSPAAWQGNAWIFWQDIPVGHSWLQQPTTWVCWASPWLRLSSMGLATIPKKDRDDLLGASVSAEGPFWLLAEGKRGDKIQQHNG